MTIVFESIYISTKYNTYKFHLMILSSVIFLYFFFIQISFKQRQNDLSFFFIVQQMNDLKNLKKEEEDDIYIYLLE